VEPGQLDEQREIQPSQRLPLLLRPLLVAVLGQELAFVQFDGRPVCHRLPAATSCGGGLLKGFDVDPK
jgi:hypothetical protein